MLIEHLVWDWACAGHTVLSGFIFYYFHPLPSIPQSPLSSPMPLPSLKCLVPVLFPLSSSPVSVPLLPHLSVPPFLPSPAPFLHDHSFCSNPLTVQEVPGPAVPKAGRGPEGEALCQRAVQGQEGCIPPEVRASPTLQSVSSSTGGQSNGSQTPGCTPITRQAW